MSFARCVDLIEAYLFPKIIAKRILKEVPEKQISSLVGIIHAVGHALGGVCHVAHGDAMNILLPYGMKYNYDICKKEYGKLLLPLAGAEVYAKTEEKDRAKESIRTILKMRKKLYRMCGLPTHLREAGVKPEQFEAVARAAVNDGAMIVNPKAAGIEDVLKILAEAY